MVLAEDDKHLLRVSEKMKMGLLHDLLLDGGRNYAHARYGKLW